MQVVIDIPDEEYKRWREVREMDALIVRNSLVNGTPLDKVLEDIKTEIEECWQMYEERFDVGDCLDIIDKHISGKAESEG